MTRPTNPVVDAVAVPGSPLPGPWKLNHSGDEVMVAEGHNTGLTLARVTVAPLSELARAIIAGDWKAAAEIDPRIRHADRELFTDMEWIDAAFYALDGDLSDLSTMLADNAEHDEFCRLARARGWEWDDFRTWQDDRRAWSRLTHTGDSHDR